MIAAASFTKDISPSRSALLFATAGFGLSMLLSLNQAPQPSTYNEVASIVFFGLLAASTGSLPTVTLRAALASSWPMWLPLALVALTAIVAFLGGMLPSGLAFAYLGTVASAVTLVMTGAMFRKSADSSEVIRSVFLAFISVGCVNVAIAFFQTFDPPAQDGGLIALSHDVGRAVGNLRQPNQLASLLLWAAAACVPWIERNPQRRVVLVGVMGLLVMADALTASRTGMIGVALLVVWGLVGKRLTRSSRRALVISPVFYLIGFILSRLWSAIGAQDISRFALQGEGVSHRLEVWREAGLLILQNPMFGVGFGQFNFAWTLTPAPNRPGELFDNTHNIFVQLAVEIGIPLTVIIGGCLALATWRIVRQLRASDATVELAAVSFMLSIVFLHSLLEFPLWYPHFLMPTALLAGWAIASKPPCDVPLRRRRWTAAPGLICAFLAAAVLLDYQRVASLYSKDDLDIPLEGRLRVAAKSVVFGYHADYALATLTSQPLLTKNEIGRVVHVMLDPRLMVVWVNALRAQGEIERARYLVERMREFHGLYSPIYRNFLDECDAAPVTADNPCLPSTKPLTWRDFQDYPLH